MAGGQRPRRPQDDRAPAQVRLELRSVPGRRGGHRHRPARRRQGDPGAGREGPGEPAVGGARRRGRDRVDRAVHRPRERLQAPRGRRPQGRHLGAGDRARRDRRAGRQLRRGLRPRQPQRDLQRLVHDQLPGPDREGAARHRRHQARADDDDPRLHRRPAPAGHAAPGSAAGPRRGDQPDPRLDRRGKGDRRW